MGINSKRPRSPHRTHLASFTAIKSRKENLKVECFTIAYMVMQHNTLKVQAAKNQGLSTNNCLGSIAMINGSNYNNLIK